MGKFTAREQQIVSMLLETKAVNFEAIGQTVAQQGASAVFELDGEDVFCGTMRRFIRVYRLNDPVGELGQIVELAKLQQQVRG